MASGLPRAALSAICGGIVFAVFKLFVPETDAVLPGGEVWAVLGVDESRDDRRVRDSLAALGLADVVSESAVELPVDDFGVFKMVSLDRFRAELEPYDPRDTGFAAHLRSFFVRDGKRFFFLPVDSAEANGLKKEITGVFGNTPYSLTLLGQRQSYALYFVLLLFSCAASLFLSHSRLLFAFQLPVLLAFGRAAASGFVCAALLSAIWELLREPLRQLSAAYTYRRRAGAGGGGARELLRPFRLNLLLAFLVLVLYSVFCAARGISPVPEAAGLLLFLFLDFSTAAREAARAAKSGHILFTPVPLLPRRSFYLFPFLLPFALGAALAATVPALVPLEGDNEKFDAPFLVSAGEYREYIDFQRAFPYRTLDPKGDLSKESYLRYYKGEDGLIAGAAYFVHNEPEAPPFPLEKLMDFLVQYNRAGEKSGTEKASGDPSGTPGGVNGFFQKEWLFVGIILVLGMLDKVRHGKNYSMKKRNSLLGERLA